MDSRMYSAAVLAFPRYSREPTMRAASVAMLPRLGQMSPPGHGLVTS